MRLQISLPKPKRRKLLIVRRVVGESMRPNFLENRVVYASGYFRSLGTGDVVIIRHGGLEKIKRVNEVSNEGIFVLGDNPDESTDSRAFGFVPREAIVAKVLWPRR